MSKEDLNASAELANQFRTFILSAVEEALSNQNFTPAAQTQEIAENMISQHIDPWKPYTAKEVAKLLSMNRKSVYRLEGLKRTEIGFNGGSVRFLGINIQCYLAGIEGVDLEAVARKNRKAFLKQAQTLTNSDDGAVGTQRFC